MSSFLDGLTCLVFSSPPSASVGQTAAGLLSYIEGGDPGEKSWSLTRKALSRQKEEGQKRIIPCTPQLRE